MAVSLQAVIDASKRAQTGKLCRCRAYPFPHRPGGGDCRGGDVDDWLEYSDRLYDDNDNEEQMK